jgi:opacity protein-like surface antigen
MIGIYGAMAASLVLVTSSAGADPTEAGAYVGTGLALGHHRLDIYGEPGLNVLAGYRFSKHLAAEGQFQWIPGFNIKHIRRNDFKWTYSANVKAYWPIGEGKIQPHAVLGIGATTVKFKKPIPTTIPAPDETGFTLRLGAGLDYYLTDQIALSVAWSLLLPKSDLTGQNFQTTTFGAQYKF